MAVMRYFPIMRQMSSWATWNVETTSMKTFKNDILVNSAVSSWSYSYICCYS